MRFHTSFTSLAFFNHLVILFYSDVRCLFGIRTFAPPLLAVPTSATSLADVETFEYTEEEPEFYYYYYADESVKSDPYANSIAANLEVKTPPPEVGGSTDLASTTSTRTADLTSGFIRKPKEDDGDVTNVIPLWDEPYMVDVKASYGCILHDEKVQLDNELFGFEVEVSDQEKLRQERMVRIRRDRERGWNRQQQQGGADDRDASSSSSHGGDDGGGDDDGGSSSELDGDGNPIVRSEKKATEDVEVASGQALGADCHLLLCASCQIVVEEFAQALAQTSRSVVSARTGSAAPLFVEDVFRREFCVSKPFTHRYSDLVYEVCRKFDNSLGGSRPLPSKIVDPRLQHLLAKFNKIKEGYGYGEILFGHFERSLDSKDEDEDTSTGVATWADKVVTPGFLAEAKRYVCRTMGACNATGFSAVQTKTRQERWTPQCHVCQALAADLEARLQLLRRLESEDEVAQIIRQTCERLALAPEYDVMCRQIVSDIASQPGGARSLDEVAWMAKLHGESLAAKKDRNSLARNSIKVGKGRGFYPDKLCETLKVCDKWETPATMEKKKLHQQVDAVFF